MSVEVSEAWVIPLSWSGSRSLTGQSRRQGLQAHPDLHDM